MFADNKELMSALSPITMLRCNWSRERTRDGRQGCVEELGWPRKTGNRTSERGHNKFPIRIPMPMAIQTRGGTVYVLWCFAQQQTNSVGPSSKWEFETEGNERGGEKWRKGYCVTSRSFWPLRGTKPFCTFTSLTQICAPGNTYNRPT